ncbi:MAG: ATP-binding domain-containing protein [Polyangiaceae bacterium]|nr:ATP-binding domain-containing protein [Polyangiaceae bacterium]
MLTLKFRFYTRPLLAATHRSDDPTLPSTRRTPDHPPERGHGRTPGSAREHERIVQEEEALCDKVVAHVRTPRPSRPPPRYEDDRALITLRDEIATARLEDVPALMAAMERVSAVANQRGQQALEPVDPGTPYFGHLRLDEPGRGVRDVLIGKTTFIEPRLGIRIVDWRHAPVSQLYYRYEEGASYEETFGERDVEGRILARRTVTIQDGKLARVASPQGTFVKNAEGGWDTLATQQSALAGGERSAIRPDHMRGVIGGGIPEAQRTNRRLPEIAALLDPRQFELISQPDTGLVVIHGGAGSGKTTIGVHRLAFLAYQSGAQRMAPERMLVIVGSPALRAYIGELLVALDMDAVKVETFAEWAKKARQKCFEWLDVPVEENTPAAVTRLKTDGALLRLLERRAGELVAEGRRTPRDALWLWAEVLTDERALERAFEEHGTGRLNREDLARAFRYCAERCPAVLEHQGEEREHDSLAPRSDDEPARGDRGERGERGDRGEEGGERGERGERGQPAETDDGIVEEGPDEHATLDAEDDALLLRAFQLVCGPVRTRKGTRLYDHVFVDEAQDLAPVDLAVLLHTTTERRSVTLAGDTSQRLNTDSGFNDWRQVLQDLGLEHTAIEPLRIAYRSTREVLHFARDVLGPLADPIPPVAPRSGAPVEHHHFPGPGAAVAFLADALRPLAVREPRATVAILARYAEQADAYYDALGMAEVPNLRRVRHYDFIFRPGVEITEVRQVKGLEYDYVILVDVNAATYPTDDASRYLLHIGATRAAHQLWIVSSGAPSKLIPSWLG